MIPSRTCLLLPAALLLLLTACSNSEEPQQSSIDQATDTAARKAVERIQHPIDQATLAREVSEARIRKMDESAQQQ